MKFDDRIRKVAETLNEVTTPVAAVTQPAPVTNGGAPATAQQAQVPPTAGQPQGQPQDPNQTQSAEQVAFALANTPPEAFKGIKPDDFKAMMDAANQYAVQNPQAQPAVAGQQPTGPDGNPANPAVASNPTTTSAQPQGTTTPGM